jgi:hypothetical protein
MELVQLFEDNVRSKRSEDGEGEGYSFNGFDLESRNVKTQTFSVTGKG